MFLQPMKKWHLYADFKNGVNAGGRIQYVWLFGIVGLFVLLLACINYMNLSTARAEKRAKEVGIRKTIGCVRRQLIGQFYSESLLVVVFSFLFAIALVQLCLPWFNDVANKKMFIPWGNPFFWLTIVHPEDKERMRSEVLFNQQCNHQIGEYRIIRKDGQVRWLRDQLIVLFNNDKQAVSYFGAVEDITDRKVIERAKGILMAAKSLSEQDAYAMMRKAAMDQKRRLAEIARAIVMAEGMLK